MRWSRAHNRLALTFIFCACSLSLYGLTQKIKRVIYINELDEMSSLSGTISSLVYLNSSFSPNQTPELSMFINEIYPFPDDMKCETRNATTHLVTKLRIFEMGPDHIKRGVCETVENPIYFTLISDEFQVPIEPEIVSQELRDTVCVSFGLMYEDAATIRLLLRYFSKKNERVVFYGANWNEDVMRELREHSPKVETVAWPLSKNRHTLNSDEDYVFLRVDNYMSSVSLSLADCWMRYAPSSEVVSFIHLNHITFGGNHPQPPPPLGSKNSIFKLMANSWKVQKFRTIKIIDNNKLSFTMSEICHSKASSLDGSCIPMQSSPDVELVSRIVKQTTLKKSQTSFFGQDSYHDDIVNCGNSNTTIYSIPEKRLEGSMDPSVSSLQWKYDPCRIRLRKSSYRCRSATEYVKRLYKNNLKVNVVLKRALIHHSDGCHL